MRNNNSFVGKLLLITVFACALMSCVSKGQQTQFYTLLPSQEKTDIPFDNNLARVSVGVGPIVLPEYIQKSSIVSFTSNNGVRVAGYHAWAGDLESNITRVLISDTGNVLNLNSVVGFPWDVRLRPDYQVRLNFLAFGGIRGEQVQITVQWSLIDTLTKNLVRSGTQRHSEKLLSESVSDYVQGLNEALNRIAFSISENIAKEIKN